MRKKSNQGSVLPYFYQIFYNFFVKVIKCMQVPLGVTPFPVFNQILVCSIKYVVFPPLPIKPRIYGPVKWNNDSKVVGFL